MDDSKSKRVQCHLAAEFRIRISIVVESAVVYGFYGDFAGLCGGHDVQTPYMLRSVQFHVDESAAHR
jgi:hypothetical protein